VILVIAHWICCSITHEIRISRRFSRDWLIDRSPNDDYYYNYYYYYDCDCY